MFGPYGGLTSGTVYHLPVFPFLLASDVPSLEEDVVGADLDHNVMPNDLSCHFPAATHIFPSSGSPALLRQHAVSDFFWITSLFLNVEECL